MTKQRFTARQPDLLDAQRHCQAHHPLDFFKAENVRFRDPLLNDRGGIGHMGPMSTVEIVGSLGFRQAIKTPEITTVSDADPQVAQGAAMRIDEQSDLGHLATGGLVAAGALVRGGMTFTEPSAETSTLRS